jgi:hypothetical protein
VGDETSEVAAAELVVFGNLHGSVGAETYLPDALVELL